MTSTTATAEGLAGSGSDHPVQVTFDRDQRINRLWGIPGIGWTFRFLVLIPHFVVLWFMQLLVGLSVLVSWIPVLLTGRQASMLVSLYTTVYSYTARVLGYAFFLAGPYPPIVPGAAAYPVNVQVDGSGPINRLWGIPFIGLWIRALLIIPHAILLFLLYFPMVLVALVVWIPILINGRAPTLWYALYGGFLRITVRCTMWILMVPGPYPPISLT